MAANSKNRIALVVYDTYVYNYIGSYGATGDGAFSNDIEAIKKGINEAKVAPSGQTYIQGGIGLAKENLTLATGNNDKKIVVFTDGMANLMKGSPNNSTSISSGTIQEYGGLGESNMIYRITSYADGTYNKGAAAPSNSHKVPIDGDTSNVWSLNDMNDYYTRATISEGLESKDKGIEVFSILFEHPDFAINPAEKTRAGFIMKNVASEGNYYETASLDHLKGIFEGISKELASATSNLKIEDPMGDDLKFEGVVAPDPGGVSFFAPDMTEPKKGTLTWDMSKVTPTEVEIEGETRYQYKMTYKVSLSVNTGITPVPTNGTTNLIIDKTTKYEFKVPEVQIDPVVSNNVTVTFKPNFTEGTVPLDKTQTLTGGSGALNSNTFTRPGYDFAGWNTQADGNGTDYANEANVTLSGDTTLYAKWTAKTDIAYSLTVYLQDKDGKYIAQTPITGNDGKTGEEKEFLSDTYKPTTNADKYSYSSTETATGIGNAGNTTTATGVKTTIKADGTTTASLYYERKSYTVSFDKGSSDTGTKPGNETGLWESEITVPQKGDLEKSGYDFGGWTTDPTGGNGGTDYNPGDKITLDENITLYPKWTAKGKISINYDGNGQNSGTVPSKQEVNTGSSKTVSTEGNLEKDGYKFIGWNTKADGNGTSYLPGSSITPTEDTTLYAVWEKISSGGGNGSNKPKPKLETKPNPDIIVPELNKIDHNAYLTGYPDVTFRADNNMTRAEVAVMFSNLLLDTVYDQNGFNSNFNDIKGDEWYANKVGYIVTLGIMKGYPDGSFRPDEPITRAEFATVASKFDELKQESKVAYWDLEQDHWAIGYIALASNRGWIGGYPDGSIKADSNITRAEVATVVNNMLERSADQNYVDTKEKTYLNDGSGVRKFYDLTQSHWAYYNIMEAVQAHDYNKEGKSEVWLNLKAPK